MCGIAGYLDTTCDIDAEILRRMNNIAKHRGPDDEGYALVGEGGILHAAGGDTMQALARKLPALEEAAAASNAFLGMAHRRLSIIDTAQTGHQPMQDADEKICITYNGELYNYIELKQELQSLGHTFYTGADTEVLLQAYLEWGEACVTYFNGMWAFALWDSRARKLFCSRDRLGKKTLQYYAGQGKFLFGSEIKQVLEHPCVPRRMNEAYLATLLLYGIGQYDEQTLLCDIRTLRAGHNLVISVSEAYDTITGMEEYPYWELDTAACEMEEPAAVSRVGEALFEAVRLRLRSDVPVGALLSGGLDSSAVVTLVCAHIRKQGGTPESFQTFTTAYENAPEIDERQYAHLVTENAGCAENWISAQDSEIWKEYERLIWHTETIAPFQILGAFNMLKAVAARGTKVLLNGQCGDETLFGYERYYAFYFRDLLRKGKVRKLLREFRQAALHSNMTAAGLMKYYAYFNIRFVRENIKNKRAKRLYTPRLQQALPYASVRRLLYPQSMEQLTKQELTQVQLPQLLYWDDRMSMAFGIESRVPFADYRFVETAAAVPPAQKIAEGYTKCILRKYMQGKMPDEIVWRTNKMGYPAPTADWMAHIEPEYAEQLLEGAKSAPYFQMQAMRKPDGAPDIKQMLDSGFMATELFMRRFGVQTSG